MESNILPGEPGYSTETMEKPWLTNPPTTKAQASVIEIEPRKLFSIGVFAFAVWYFGFRNKGKKK